MTETPPPYGPEAPQPEEPGWNGPPPGQPLPGWNGPPPSPEPPPPEPSAPGQPGGYAGAWLPPAGAQQPAGPPPGYPAPPGYQQVSPASPAYPAGSSPPQRPQGTFTPFGYIGPEGWSMRSPYSIFGGLPRRMMKQELAYQRWQIAQRIGPQREKQLHSRYMTLFSVLGIAVIAITLVIMITSHAI